MWKRSMTYADWQAPAQRNALAALWRQNKAMPALCDTLVFWRLCGRRVCKRQHGCSGDPQACFERQWARCSEDAKVGIRAFIEALAAGVPYERAIEAADAEFVRNAALLANVARRNTGAAKNEPSLNLTSPCRD